MPRKTRTLSEESSATAGNWLVAFLCAEWCGSCREFRAAFDTLAARFPNVWFRWIDIEDEAALVDDIDVDSFPTIMIQRDAEVFFLGATLPHAAIVEGQLAQFRAGSAAKPIEAPDLLAWIDLGSYRSHSSRVWQ